MTVITESSRAIAATLNNVAGVNKNVDIPSVSADNLLQNIISAVFFLIGFISVVMILVGSIKFLTSNGDSSKNKQARMTLTYAIVGLVVSISAYSIITWVLDNIQK